MLAMMMIYYFTERVKHNIQAEMLVGYTYNVGSYSFCMSLYLSIYDNPCKMRKCVWFWEAVSISRGRGRHCEAIDSASGSCSMQPQSWLLWTDPGWSVHIWIQFHRFSQKIFFLWKNVGTAKWSLLAETFTFWNAGLEMLLDPNRPSGQKGRTSQAVCQCSEDFLELHESS